MTRPAFVVHSLRHALAAAAAAEESRRAVALLSAAEGAAFAGPGWLAALAAAARGRHPGADLLAVLDCGADPGRALAALREGLRAVRLSAPDAVLARVAAVAAVTGAVVNPSLGPCLDLLAEADAERTAGAFLASRAIEKDGPLR